MIDTDKYEGHTPGPWVVLDGMLWRKHANGNLYLMFELEPVPLKEEIDPQLMADAPLLLAEVKRMREDTLKVVSQWFDSDENEWRKLEQALGLPLTPLSWEVEE